MKFSVNQHISKAAAYKRWNLFAVLVIILISGAIQIRLLSLPLERDEGEYAYAGQLILQGITPYAEVYNMKMPGIYAAYAGILFLFGQTDTGIHAALLVINVITTLLLFGLFKRLFGSFVGVAAAGAFAILIISRHVQGLSANAEHFVLLPAIAGVWLLIIGIDSRKVLCIFFAAFLLGISFLMKQHGAFFVLFAFLYLCYQLFSLPDSKFRNSVFAVCLFLIGACLPFAITCLILWGCGVFDKFWFWTFEYSRQYISYVPFGQGLEYLKQRLYGLAGSSILIWLFASAGLIILFINKNFSKHAVFAIGLLIFSFLAVCPGFYFRPHYFVLLLPAVSLLAGIGLGGLAEILSQRKIVIFANCTPLIVLAVLSFCLYQERHFFFIMSPEAASRASYGMQPFSESLEIAKYIKEHSSPNDRIAVVGSEPQILFYSKRHSATGYIYTYPLMDLNPYASKMQQEMISEIEQTRPRFIVFVRMADSWLGHKESDRSIFKWLESYSSSYYNIKGIIQILPDSASLYSWDNNVETTRSKSESLILVYERTN